MTFPGVVIFFHYDARDSTSTTSRRFFHDVGHYDCVIPTTSVRDLWIYIDSDVSMRTYVSRTVSSSFAVYASNAASVGLCRQQHFSRAGRLAGAVASGLRQRHACPSTHQPTRQTTVSSQCCRTSRVFGTETRAYHTVTSVLALASGTSARRVQAGNARLSLSARSGTIVPSWRLTTRGRSRIEACNDFVVIISRACRSTKSSLRRRRPSLSGFSCSCLERTTGTRHIVAVATHIQTPFELTFPFSRSFPSAASQ